MKDSNEPFLPLPTVVLKNKAGQLVGADYQAWADTLTPAQTAFLWNVLERAIAERDSTIVLQIYCAAANRWQSLDRLQQVHGAGEGEERFFSQEALENDEEDRRKAREVVDNPERADNILLTGGFDPGSGRVM